jgi:hypothetical protein
MRPIFCWWSELALSFAMFTWYSLFYNLYDCVEGSDRWMVPYEDIVC